MNKELQEILNEKVPNGYRVILAGYVGSIAHGTNLGKDNPNHIDDKDVMVIYLGDKRQYLGFHYKDNFRYAKDEWDILGYDFKRYIELLCKNNPNVMSLLWAGPLKHFQKFLAIPALRQPLMNMEQRTSRP